MNTLAKIQKYLRILLDTDVVYKTLQEKFPDLLDDLISAKTNPTCTCNKRVVEGLTKRYEESEEYKKLIEDIFSMQDVVESITAYDDAIEEWKRKEEKLFNNVHIVGKSPEEWGDFREFVRSHGLHIQAVSIIDKGDTLEVRFI